MSDLVPPVALASERESDRVEIDACTEIVVEWIRRAEQLDEQAGRVAKRRRRRLAAVVTDQSAAAFTMALTDEVLRIKDPATSARHFAHVVDAASLSSLALFDRVLLKVGAEVAPKVPHLVMPLVVQRLRRETSHAIISADSVDLNRHRRRQEANGFDVNVNRLGEAILGHDEAAVRRRDILNLIEQKSVAAMSIKLSAVAANLSPLAFDATVDRVVELLLPIFRAAHLHGVFVNLDMEEYRDLALTCDVFIRVMNDPTLLTYTGGIVLQAYLPDSHAAADQLGSWATQRVNRGGAPIRIRLVKGANLAMEVVDAEMHGWAQATYSTKSDVDASWKRLLDTLLDERFDSSVVVGAASHNLFDVAWALRQRTRLVDRGAGHRVRFEMLEGMAEAQAAAVLESSGDMLMYTPVVAKEDFVSAIGYLTRRLDENTGADNFLRALVNLRAGSSDFVAQQKRFAEAVTHRRVIATDSRRGHTERRRPADSGQFFNSPDTDMTQRAARERLVASVSRWSPADSPPEAHTTTEVDQVVESARAGAQRWAGVADQQRADHLRAVARYMADRRADIVSLLAHSASKTITEGDVEVSEAIDFANYYACGAAELAQHPTSSALGVVVVAPPWNFPYAITMGGVLASLAAGNAVILKPTPQCPIVAAAVAQHCWDAGIPRSALHLLTVPDNEIGRHLITHDGVDAVILTGSADTAYMFLDWKPSLRLLAETSGKNSMIICGSADIDLAIRDLVKSAFGHSGQKCSAASLAIVDQHLYDDPTFQNRLADAVRSLTCGPSTDQTTDVTPLVETPSGNLLRALTILDSSETWLVEPKRFDATDRAWSPGVKVGVADGSWFHTNECFGPVLGLMRAEHLDHAIELQNRVPFGLTAGIQSLNDEEVVRWVERAEAGNLYVNRTITGAVVQRQPFGGWKRSSVGPGAKAGGPSYVHVLRRWAPGSDLRALHTMASLTAQTHDPSGLKAEANILRYRPLPNGVLAYVGPDATKQQRTLFDAAASATKCVTMVFMHDESGEQRAIDAIEQSRPDRVRILGSATDHLRRAAHAVGARVDDDPMSDDPAIELVRFTREQVVSVTQHRHGRVRPLLAIRSEEDIGDDCARPSR
jgi:RHH-type transcriptional regulator, proline utilization regulon repressor / proline dehydrogenase / delta 1-pyrroline-5-carboxylate dehydrogenase